MQIEGRGCSIQIGTRVVKYKLGPGARPRGGGWKIQIPEKTRDFLTRP